VAMEVVVALAAVPVVPVIPVVLAVLSSLVAVWAGPHEWLGCLPASVARVAAGVKLQLEVLQSSRRRRTCKRQCCTARHKHRHEVP